MAERAAHLVDDVFPDVPVRQWVLSLPHRLRYQVAWRHDLCRAVVAIFMRAAMRALRAIGTRRGIADGRGGGVAIIQRFGGALNLNIHVHALLVDGVFAPARDGGVGFHRVSPTDLDVAEVLSTVEARVGRLLDRRGLGARDDEGGEAWEGTPVLAGLAAASVQGTLALGPVRGRRVGRLGMRAGGVEALATGPRHARANGFDLHANVVVPSGQRDRLETVCRYALRPPVAAEHVHLTDEGGVLLQLRHRLVDGTTHLLFDPVEFLGRLAVLVPRPRINLILYYGMLGPRASWRRQVVPAARRGESSSDSSGTAVAGPEAIRSERGYLWAELMRRTFGFDVLACRRCGNRLRLIALVDQAAAITRMLAHLRLPTAVPEPHAARPPPLASLGVHPGDDSGPLFDPCS